MINTTPLIYISFAKIYEFGGWKFEYDRNKPFAPHPLKKDLEPRKRVGNVFWGIFDDFSKLSIKQQEARRIF